MEFATLAIRKIDHNAKAVTQEGNNMRRLDIATPEEVLEAELLIIQAAGIKVRHIGFQKGLNEGFHLYDVLEPKIAGYSYTDNGSPTLTLDGMKEKGLLK